MWMTVQTLKPRFTLASPCRRPCFPLSCRCSSTFSLTSHPCVCLSFSASDPFSHLLLPVRSRHQHPVDNAGLFSFMTLHWLSPLARKAYKASSLSLDDVWGLSCHEASEINCQRWGHRCTASRFIPVKKKKIFVLNLSRYAKLIFPFRWRSATPSWASAQVVTGIWERLFFSPAAVVPFARWPWVCFSFWANIEKLSFHLPLLFMWTWSADEPILFHTCTYTHASKIDSSRGEKKKKKTSPKSKAVSSAVWEREATQWCGTAPC